MAAEVAQDLTFIQDEDVLRRMWQQTDDFGRKKEIRQRMYKLREQRLKDFYTGEDSLTIMSARKHTAPTHADSIADQGFMSLKSKEIRDSESPTRDIHRRGDNTYWNTTQQSSYNTQGDEGDLRKSYERTSTGKGQSEDRNTQMRLEADERGFTNSKTTESENSKTMTDQKQHDAHIATSSHTKTDDGEAYSYSTSQDHQEAKSSKVESKDGSSAFTSSSTRWESSSSSSSTRKVVSSSNYAITDSSDLKAITSKDDVDFAKNFSEDFNTSTIRRNKNTTDSKRYQTSDRYDNQETSTFIDNEMRNNIRNSLKDANIEIREDHFAHPDSRRDSTSTCTSEVIITNSADSKDTIKRVSQDSKVEERSNVVDQKIMSEISKLDSFLSTQNTPGTSTPVSPRSVMGEVNWTVVSNTDGEFVYRDDKGATSPGSRATPIKQPNNLDLPKECTEGQYVTTYNEHYTTKRVSQDVSPSHDAFARSLRQTPPGTPRSLSRASLDRGSPERKTKGSPRASPDKERRTSVGSYTIEKPSNVRRKTSEVSRQTATSKDSSLKSKRKFSTTQTKAAAKARASTPGTSPSTSPSRKQKERSPSPSSASDSDASQVSYEKKTSFTYKQGDVVRKNLVDSFEKDSPAKASTETITKSSSRPTSPEKSPSRKASISSEKKPTSILRKESKSETKSTIETVTENKKPSGIAPHMREKSPEYSSEGSVGKEIRNSQARSSPDSSPERAAFKPIKQFRTSPELTSQTIQVTATETDQSNTNLMTETFIAREAADSSNKFGTIHIDVKITENASSNKDFNKKGFSPKKESPDRSSQVSRKDSKSRSPSPQKSRTPSPTKQTVTETVTTRKETITRKSSLKRDKSPPKTDRSVSPTKSVSRKPSLPQRSPSPQKQTSRPSSPSKASSRKPSVSSRSPSPNKARSPSPTKNLSAITTTTTTVTKTSILKGDSPFSKPTKTRKSFDRSPSPDKKSVGSRASSPKKESPERQSKSPSPQRFGGKRPHQQVSSPSVSPCSSPERAADRKSENSKPIRRSGPKSPDTTRTTRRSSIPRADQTTLTKKTVETKIVLQPKQVSKIPSSTTKPKTSAFRNVRTDSQSSLDRQTTTTRSYSSTIKKTIDTPKQVIKKTITPTTKKTVTTTAVISLQKPTLASQIRQSPSNTSNVSRATTYKRTSSKELTQKKTDVLTDRKPVVTSTTKRPASRTNTPKSKPVEQFETRRFEQVTTEDEKIQSSAFIEQLRQDETTIHGYKDETINIEIEDNDLENETRPDLYPDTEEDEEHVEPKNIVESENHVTEKTINVDSTRKVASQIVVTLKKPTGATIYTPTKTTTRPVTNRSSSGPLKSSPQTPMKQTPIKSVNNKRQPPTSVQKADSLSSLKTNDRTTDRSTPKGTPQKRQLSKPEMSTSKTSVQQTRVTSARLVTETGIASRNATPAKSATLKRVPAKKKPSKSTSSSSEDEGDNIPSVITPNRQEQEYIEELEEMRRNEESQYAAKLTATSNQENQLLSVIVQHPKSSRESSPDYSNRSQPFSAVSDDGGATPRYADMISEPEDVEVFAPLQGSKLERYSQKKPIQVTDLDDESEAEDKLNVSVADRVSHFLEASKVHCETPIREEPEVQDTSDSKSVLKAKAMFETIAKNQMAPPAPNNKPVDILSRPSVFEARRGHTAPKPLPCDEPSDHQVQRRGSIHTLDQENVYEVKKYEDTHVEIEENIRQQSPSPVREITTPTKTKPNDRTHSQVKEKPTETKQEPVIPKPQPEQAPKADPTPSTIKKESPKTLTKKKSETNYKPKPFEKTISATAEISSKRAFFERKAQTQSSPQKETQPRSPVKERKPLTDSIQNKENIKGSSPTRKTSQTTTFIENERKSSRVSPERKLSSSSPVKERKHSIRSESPERKISLSKSVKERRSSFTKEDIVNSTSTLQKKDSVSKIATDRKPSLERQSPERQSPERQSPERQSPERQSPERRAPITQKNFPEHKSKTFKESPSPKTPSSPVKDRKPSFPRESPERSSPQRKSSRGSPERLAKSPERSSPSSEQAELNKAGKFGVTLRRTSSTTSATTQRRTSVPGETQEIEDVTDLSLLEIMMEKAVGYEQRRRIRAQIRVVKKVEEDRIKSNRQKSPTRSFSKTSQESTRTQVESRKETRRASSPTKSQMEREKIILEQRSSVQKSSRTSAEPSKPTAEANRPTTETSKPTADTNRPTSPTKRRQSPEPKKPTSLPLTNGFHRPASPDRRSPTVGRKESVEESVVVTKTSVNGYHQPTVDSVRRSSKTETTETTTVRTQKRTETLVETGVDSITSSYGVGPTDERGRPLFGLRALRRSNTNKQLTDEVDKSPQQQTVVENISPVNDSRGRPLFGGLKALRQQTTEVTVDSMPEQTSTQLRELVQRHERVVKETNGPQEQSRQKPKAKLRDSFILQEDEQVSLSNLGNSDLGSTNRGLNLKSIIQRHENISGSGGVVCNEMESSHTVTTSRTAVSSDGRVSHSRDTIQGELSAKNGEAPAGKVTRTQVTYERPQGEDKGVSKVTTTTAALGRRTSGPRITEIEDGQETGSRRSSVKRTSLVEERRASLRKTPSEDDERRFSCQEEEEEVSKATSRISSSTHKYTSSSTDDKSRLRRQKSSEEADTEEKPRKTVVRGDSVRALQHKFQQATENAGNTGRAARAGLILRTSSFTTADASQDKVSSTLKQSTVASADKRGRQSPDTITDSRRESLTSRRDSLTKGSSETTTRVTETSSSTASSFLNNRTPVTGVQDILDRMRNADLVNETGDTDADREARALLNKFLGASVILQAMEAGGRATNGSTSLPEGTPGSAALVSSVEKQRKATTRQKEEDIDNIWDEQVLNNLLDQCTDYDGRRKLRARLRTVMAEHKACADLVAVTGDRAAADQTHNGECHTPVDDSGTESGEDFRLLSPEILAEVQSALTRLEAALPGLDPSRREALVRLVTRLQTCLKLQPQPPPVTAPTPPQPPVRRYANRRQRSQRHTVGVSKEELADARRWLQETRSQASSGITPEPSVEVGSTNLTQEEEKSQGFRPVKFNPNQGKEYLANDFAESEPFDPTEDTGEVIISAQLSYALPTHEVQKVDSGSSLLEYDPSLALFTPSQSVQIAVHKAAINKQISQEESKREHNKREESYDSEDGDVSSVEGEMATGQEGLEDAISSAQRLLQIASDGNKKTQGRFNDRSSKKHKMKRANTIDIPKPPNFYNLENSSDERDDRNRNYQNHLNGLDKIVPPPTFKPKSESDLKFLAFLHQANKNEAKASTYNPSARGGAPWTSRFVNLKTAFESGPTEIKETPIKKTSLPTVFQMWENTVAKQPEAKPKQQKLNNHNRTPQPLQNKLPWSSKQEQNGVVIGSLTVKPSPKSVNKFSHAPLSAFKPIEKKPVSYVQPQKLIIQPQPKPVSKTAQFSRGKSLDEITFKVAEPPQQPVVTKLAPSVSGTVKQLATQKFSGENIPVKPVIKQYPVIQDKQFNTVNLVKNLPFVDPVTKPMVSSAPIHHIHPSVNFAPSIASVQKQFNHPDPEPVKPIKIPQKPATKIYKEGNEYSPPKQYINSPPLSQQYAEPFEYPSETKFNNSFPNVINHEKRVQTPELPQDVSVPYYSQIPAYVQHSTYAQPQIPTPPPNLPFQHQIYPLRPEPVEASSPKFSQQNHNSFVHEERPSSHKITDSYTNGNVSPIKMQNNNDHFVADNTKYEEPVYFQHRFSEETLVPNPLNLSQVVRPVHLDYAPYEPPVRPPLIQQPSVNFTSHTPLVPAISNNLYENNSSQGSLNSSKLSDSSSSLKQYLNIPYESSHDLSPAVSNTSKSPYLESGNSSGAASPQWNTEEPDENDQEISISEGTEIQTAVARVMGQHQCQKAVTVANRTQRRFDEDKSESQNLLRTLLKSPNSPTSIARRPSSEKLQNNSDSYRPPKSPLLDDSPKYKSVPENRLNAISSKPPVVITPQSYEVLIPQIKPVSTAVSAFRPLVNSYTRPAEADYHRLPPVPTSPTCHRKLDSDNQYKQMHSSNKLTQNSSSSKYYSSELSSRNTSSVSPSKSPSFPNVLQKSESWHQLVKEQMSQGRHPPPKSPRLSKTKSSHTLAFPKQYEAHLTPETLAVKQSTVDQYLKSPTKQLTKSTKQMYKQKKTVNVVKLDDNLENVDEAFESLFQEVAKKK